MPIEAIEQQTAAAQNNNSDDEQNDSEEELEIRGRMVKDLTGLSWTPRIEGKLEEMLINNAFDFSATAKEFQRYLNSSDNPDVMPTVYFKIDAKPLQMKWTDIEIRKHVIPNEQAKEAEGADEDVEDDLPPLNENDVPQLEEMEPSDRIIAAANRDQAPSPEREQN